MSLTGQTLLVRTNTFPAVYDSSNDVLHRVYDPKISSLSPPLTIFRNKILQPPAAPVKTLVKQLEGRSKVNEIIPSTSRGYQDVTAHDYEQFFCINRVVHRLEDNLRP